MIFLLTEIYIDTAEIGPMKVSLRFTVDIIMQVFFSRQFHHCVLPCPGGCPGQGGGVRHPQCGEEKDEHRCRKTSEFIVVSSQLLLSFSRARHSRLFFLLFPFFVFSMY